MSYHGTERRVQDHRDPLIICKQEDKIGEMALNVAEIKGDVKSLDLRINGSLEKISSHITEGDSWRKLIVGTAFTLVLAIIGGVGTTWIVTSQLSYNLGAYAKQIMVNTERLSNLEAVVHGERN